MIAKQFVEPRAAHDVREQDGYFRLGASQTLKPQSAGKRAARGS